MVRSNISLIEFFIPLSIMIMAIAATLGVSMANKNSKYSKLVYGVTVFLAYSRPGIFFVFPNKRR